jgi:glycerol kinase
MEAILTLDLGTSSTRALCFSMEGEVLFSSSFRYAPTYHPAGKVRQRPSDWEEGSMKVLKEAGTFLRETGCRPAAISVTSQRASLISVDAEGGALHDAIMWHDKTTLPQCDRIRKLVPDETMYQKTGLRTDAYFSAPKILQLREKQPDVFAKAHRFLGVQDFVIAKLTGKYLADYSQACRTLLFNISKKCWDEEILTALSIPEEMLPETVEPGTVCGGLRKEFARTCGLEEGIPVVAAGGDQQVAALGMGVFREGAAEVNTGTGAFVITTADRPVFHPKRKTLCSYSAIPGNWVAEAGVLTAGIIYNWFAGEFMSQTDGPAEDADFKALDRLVDASPPGANGLITLPHFKGTAAPYWNPKARGIFFNVTLATKKADFARSVLEAVALEINENIFALNEIDSISIREITVAGGMTEFALFNRIQADVYGLKVRKDPHSEASSFGAFLSALAAVGRFESAVRAYEALSKTAERAETFSTNAKNHKVYQAVRHQRNILYRALNERGVYEELSALEEHLYKE